MCVILRIAIGSMADMLKAKVAVKRSMAIFAHVVAFLQSTLQILQAVQ